MSVKFYTITWLIFLGIVGLFFVTGNLTPIAGVVFGFFVFGWIFMGMMSVIPGGITHPTPVSKGPGSLEKAKLVFRRSVGRFRHARDSWMSSNSIEVRRPKFH
jgi:hypothetical protein